MSGLTKRLEALRKWMDNRHYVSSCEGVEDHISTVDMALRSLESSASATVTTQGTQKDIYESDFELIERCIMDGSASTEDIDRALAAHRSASGTGIQHAINWHFERMNSQERRCNEFIEQRNLGAPLGPEFGYADALFKAHSNAISTFQAMLAAAPPAQGSAVAWQDCSVCGESYPRPIELHHDSAECVANQAAKKPYCWVIVTEGGEQEFVDSDPELANSQRVSMPLYAAPQPASARNAACSKVASSTGSSQPRQSSIERKPTPI